MPKPTHSPTRRRLIGAAVASYLLSFSHFGFAKRKTIKAIRIWSSSSYSSIAIESSQPIKFNKIHLHNPERLVIDLQNTNLNQLLRDAHKKVNPSDLYIKAIRVGQFDKDTSRIVIELKRKIHPRLSSIAPIAKFSNRLVINLYPESPHQNNEILDLMPGDKSTKTISVNKHRSIKKSFKNNKTIVVMLDPGHGGEDPGATGPSGTHEKDIVLKIAKKLKKLIEKERNMEVHLTREDDIFIPLDLRVSKAQKINADLLISIHADAFTTPKAKGSSVFALAENGATSVEAKFLAKVQNESDKIGGVIIDGKDAYLAHTLFDLTQTATINASLCLGKHVLNKIGQINFLHNNNVEQANFAVLKAPDIPSILVETAFLSNSKEEQKLKTSNFQQKIAESILSGIKEYCLEQTS